MLNCQIGKTLQFLPKYFLLIDFLPNLLTVLIVIIRHLISEDDLRMRKSRAAWASHEELVRRLFDKENQDIEKSQVKLQC